MVGEEYPEDHYNYFCFRGHQVNSDLEFIPGGEVRVFNSVDGRSGESEIKLHDVIILPDVYFGSTRLKIKKKYGKNLVVGDIVVDNGALYKITGYEEDREYESYGFTGAMTDIYLTDDTATKFKVKYNVYFPKSIDDLIEFVVLDVSNSNEITDMTKYKFHRKYISKGDIVRLNSKLFKIITEECPDDQAENYFYCKGAQVNSSLEFVSNGEIRIFDTKHTWMNGQKKEVNVWWHNVLVEPDSFVKKMIKKVFM
jgi:hypothetical protein